MARNWRPTDYGSYTITGTAAALLTFADSGSPSTMPVGTKSFRGKLYTAGVRFRDDGTAPTATEGEEINVGDAVVLSEGEIANGSWIRTGTASGVLKGHFYNVEPDVLLGGG